ncbi:MAG: response regulator [Nitrospirae bacterium]|nr:response regulator [Nitrospirota bacterium]MBF0541745.1 response regulator [Nitrospirota bacterium]
MTNKSEPLKLLLVDDETGYVEILSKRMSKRGIEVTAAYSGAEAIRAMRGRYFDAAVLDLKMEDMDGIEILKILRTMDSKMPVIMLTGHGSERAAREGIKYGAYDYLTKPCNFDELVTKIKTAGIGDNRGDGDGK